MSIHTPVIVDAVRSPMGKGKAGGALSGLHAVELLSQLLQAVVTRNRLDPGLVDDVLVGCVTQAGEQAATPGRQAWLAAGFPEHVPSVTIDRRCGSSQQAVHFAAHGVAAGAYDVAIAAGVESMSRVPMGSARMGMDPFGPGVTARYAPGLVTQGMSAELIAARYGLTRRELDEFAARSHQRAAAAAASGLLAREITPITVDDRVVDQDETIRPSSTADALGALQPAFRSPEMEARFPDIEWKVTAGNASQITDGAAAVLIMSEARAVSLGLVPRARFVAFDVRGDDPLLMLTAPIESTRRALARAGLAASQIDQFEVNEAFASVPLAWQREHHVDPDRLNPSGGAIALGHPLGASGARLMCTLINGLEHSGGRFGLQAMCEAGGMANTTIIERL